jgi:hypothetical protein
MIGFALASHELVDKFYAAVLAAATRERRGWLKYKFQKLCKTVV